MAEYIVRETGYPGAVKQEIVCELVRCKDCKYAIDWDEKLGCEWHGFYSIKPDWFCADGERREDDND